MSDLLGHPSDTISKKRERFRAGVTKIMAPMFRTFDRLESLAGTQSYEIDVNDLVEMRDAIDARLDQAFETLTAEANRGDKPKVETAPFSFGSQENAQ